MLYLEFLFLIWKEMGLGWVIWDNKSEGGLRIWLGLKSTCCPCRVPFYIMLWSRMSWLVSCKKSEWEMMAICMKMQYYHFFLSCLYWFICILIIGTTNNVVLSLCMVSPYKTHLQVVNVFRFTDLFFALEIVGRKASIFIFLNQDSFIAAFLHQGLSRWSVIILSGVDKLLL